MVKEEASLVFKALGDPNRLKIVKLLINNKEICACSLLEIVNCKQSTLSHHLAILSNCGLLDSRRDKKNIIYSINMDKLNSVVNFLSETCDECRKLGYDEVK